jgi:hypothetical protein
VPCIRVDHLDETEQRCSDWQSIASEKRELGTFKNWKLSSSSSLLPMHRLRFLGSDPTRSIRLLSNSIPQRDRSTPTNCGTREYPSYGFQFLYFNQATLAPSKVLLASQQFCRVQFSVEKRLEMENELPFRTGAGGISAGFGDHDNAPARCAKTSASSRLNDDFSFHVRVDRAQVVIVTRSCKSEGELGVLDESF